MRDGKRRVGSGVVRVWFGYGSGMVTFFRKAVSFPDRAFQGRVRGSFVCVYVHVHVYAMCMPCHVLHDMPMSVLCQ